MEKNEVAQTLDILTECLDLLSRYVMQIHYTQNDAQQINQKISAARRHIKKIKQQEE